jgi:hypothetical protein
MWEVFGWAAISLGALLLAWTAVAKLVTARKTRESSGPRGSQHERMRAPDPTSAAWTNVFSGLLMISTGLALMAHGVWARTAEFTLFGAATLMGAYEILRRRRQAAR